MSAAELKDQQAMVIREPEQLTAKEVRAQVNLVQEVMKGVMQNGTHYGKVPGCGDKPTLLKPGAEKLASTFRLAINPEIEDLSTKDMARYRIKTIITHQITGAFLGAGVGECSSAEEKYYWRSAVCEEEFNDTPEDRRRIKYRGAYGKVQKIKQVRTNPADVANTVLKIGKKRSLVDGILTVTGASDIFTQDIEDLPEELLDRKQPPVPAPPKSEQHPVEPPPPEDPWGDAPTQEAPPQEEAPKSGGPVITDKQRSRMYAIARNSGMNDAQFADELKRMGYKSSKDVTRDAYEDICTFFQGWKA